MRNKEDTKKNLLASLDRILKERGFEGLGINAVAREAGVSKMLIYRYFGNMEGLLEAYAGSKGFWPAQKTEMENILSENRDRGIPDLASAYMKHFLRELRKRPATQEVMRWELSHQNEITRSLATIREEQGMEMMDFLEDQLKLKDQLDIKALTALISAGISYLILRAKTADVFLGIPINDDTGWERMETIIEVIFRKLL
ncbi:MAG: TetR/AcrR family transcriptional regulator [Synergistales bacterium]|nr:TetR/AcrR family transcriptional regulator [Synergistales bacterium]